MQVERQKNEQISSEKIKAKQALHRPIRLPHTHEQEVFSPQLFMPTSKRPKVSTAVLNMAITSASFPTLACRDAGMSGTKSGVGIIEDTQSRSNKYIMPDSRQV